MVWRTTIGGTDNSNAVTEVGVEVEDAEPDSTGHMTYWFWDSVQHSLGVGWSSDGLSVQVRASPALHLHLFSSLASFCSLHRPKCTFGRGQVDE